MVFLVAVNDLTKTFPSVFENKEKNNSEEVKHFL